MLSTLHPFLLTCPLRIARGTQVSEHPDRYHKPNTPAFRVLPTSGSADAPRPIRRHLSWPCLAYMRRGLQTTMKLLAVQHVVWGASDPPTKSPGVAMCERHPGSVPARTWEHEGQRKGTRATAAADGAGVGKRSLLREALTYFRAYCQPAASAASSYRHQAEKTQ